MESIDIWKIVVVCFFSYLLGSIPFGKIISKCAKGIDIQKVGSGNIGATNVGVNLGFKYGALVAGLDIWKAVLSVTLTRYFFYQSWWIVGLSFLCVFLGHLFPVWLRFRGGKGISVFIGGLLSLLGWKVVLVIFGCWLIIFLFFAQRKMSAANLFITAGLLCFIFLIPVFLAIIPIVIIIVFLIWWAHRENLKRIARNEEPSIELPNVFNKLPDDIISLGIDNLQSLISNLRNIQNKRKGP